MSTAFPFLYPAFLARRIRMASIFALWVMVGAGAIRGAQSASPAGEIRTADVHLWDRFEGVIESSRSHADPFREVTLLTEFTRPDGTSIAFWGFHEGGRTWKFRTMADQVGVWRFRARFSDGSGAREGQFRVVPSERQGMIEVHPANPIWFGRRGGPAHLVRAFHTGDRFFAANWPAAERAQFLEFARRHGYNMLSVASHYLNRASGNRGKGWETPALWPLRPGDYARMEAILDECARHGLDVYPFAGFFGQSSNFPRDPADQELYIRYTLARLAPFANIVLNVAGPEPNLVAKFWLESRDVDRLGRLIRRLDPFGHPLSLHNETGDDEYKHSDWTTFGTLQGPKTLDRIALGRGLRKNLHWAKPLFAQETLWAGNRNHPSYTHTDLRKNAWVIHFSGANFCFADNRGNSSTGFSGTLALPDADLAAHAAVRLVWDAFAALDFAALRPDYAVTSDGWCLSDRRDRFVIYREKSGAFTPVLPPGSTFAGRWLDASNPARTIAVADVQAGAALETPPGGDDWVLDLRRR